jgi:hypothetical protein
MPSLDPQAVHCPHCGAEPGKPCRSPGGGPRDLDHGPRMHLVYGLAHPDANFYRAEAERYRMKYPDVSPYRITCAPSRAQVLWWNRWGHKLHYNRKLYEAEHGPDTSILALPPGSPDGVPVSELLEQFDKVKVPKRQ